MDDLEVSILRTTIEIEQSENLKESNVAVKRDFDITEEQLTIPLKDTVMTEVEPVVKEPTKKSSQKSVKDFSKAFLGEKRV